MAIFQDYIFNYNCSTVQIESVLIDILGDDLRDYTVVIIAHHVAGIMGAMRPGVDATATMQDGRLQTASIIDSPT